MLGGCCDRTVPEIEKNAPSGCFYVAWLLVCGEKEKNSMYKLKTVTKNMTSQNVISSHFISRINIQ